MVRRPQRVFHDLYGENKPVEEARDKDANGDILLDSAFDDFPNPEFYPLRLIEASGGHPASFYTNTDQSAHPPSARARRGSSEPVGQPNGPSTIAIGSYEREPVPSIPSERFADQISLGPDPVFKTYEQAKPPSADCEFRTLDQGISGPESIRLSMYNIPHTAALRASTALPLGVVVQPFAESDVAVADFSNVPDGPPRCVRCRAYVNPAMSFCADGSKFVCNMCQYVNSTPDEYYQPLDASGRRVDWQSRPELARGTYEFMLPEKFGKGVPLRHLFIVDVTRDSLNKSIPSNAVCAIRQALYGSENKPGGGCIAKGTKIAIMSFARAIHFYRFNGRPLVDLLVQYDIADPIVPPELFVDPQEYFEGINECLDNLEKYFVDNWEASSCYFSAISAALGYFGDHGGRVSVFMASFPSTGPGALTRRDTVAYGMNVAPLVSHGDPERELFAATSSIYRDLGTAYTKAGVMLDLFAFSTGYVDLANVGYITRVSGGVHHIYPQFVAHRDGRAFAADFLDTCAQETTATEVSICLRTSMGLQVDQYLGASEQMGGLDHRSAFAVTLKHDGRLDPNLDAHVQLAVLYTDNLGLRRLRILNLPAGVSNNYRAVLKFIDTDASIGILAREAVAKLSTVPLHEMRRQLLLKLFDVFGSCRTQAGHGLPPGQLLLPTPLRQFIALSDALTKSLPFGDSVYSADSRTQASRMLERMPCKDMATFLYPRIYALGDLAAFAKEHEGQKLDFSLVPMVPARTANLKEEECYFIFNTRRVYVYVQPKVSVEVMREVFGVESRKDVSAYIDDLPELDTAMNRLVRQLLEYLGLRTLRSWVPVQLARKEIDGAEYAMYTLLVEDAHSQQPYYELVNKVHHEAKVWGNKT